MKRIERMRLENFQSHLDTTLEFDERLNVIVGPSDSGKTAVLRALRWILYNQPRGSDFLRVSADYVRVTALFNDGTKIVREKTASKNRYRLTRPNEEELVLEGFGVHVPEEILAAHQMYGLRLDSEHTLSLQVAEQLDGPFLLSNTSAMRAKSVGRISGAHFLDMAKRDTVKDVSRLRSYYKREEQEKETLEQDIARYRGLSDSKQHLDQTKRDLDQFQDAIDELNKLHKVKERLAMNKLEKHKAKGHLSRVENVDRWELSFVKMERTKNAVSQLNSINTRKQTMEGDRLKAQQWLNKLGTVEAAEQERTQAENTIERAGALTQLKNQYDELQKNAAKMTIHLEETAFIENKQVLTTEQISQRLLVLGKLKAIQDNREQLVTKQKKVRDNLSRVDSIVETDRAMRPLTDRLEQKRKLSDLHAQKQDIEMRKREGLVFLEKNKEKLDSLTSRYQDLLELNGDCPTCGQQIKEHALKEWLNHGRNIR
ncbi:AAA family ATPase [Alteribacter populi]|uniref:AAA family ATPase n=1 Tax=Alteribacter populi TaxID=2011011 RepID=UPI000BBAE123|nr:AAA family ATPase [Alteribacter populi]